MATEATPLIVSGLSASYGVVPALRNVSLSVRSGQIVTLIGANGAGKSTLIKTICGLVRPTAGSVQLFGEDVTGLSPDQGKSTVCVASGESKPRDHLEPGQTESTQPRVGS